MSTIVYEAFKDDIEAAFAKGREEAEQEVRRETEKIRREYKEWLRKVAIGCLMSGVDPDIVCRATGYSLCKLMGMVADTN